MLTRCADSIWEDVPGGVLVLEFVSWCLGSLVRYQCSGSHCVYGLTVNRLVSSAFLGGKPLYVSTKDERANSACNLCI